MRTVDSDNKEYSQYFGCMSVYESKKERQQIRGRNGKRYGLSQVVANRLKPSTDRTRIQGNLAFG